MKNKVKTKALGLIKRIVNREMAPHFTNKNAVNFVKRTVNSCKSFREITYAVSAAGFVVENKLRKLYRNSK